MGAEPAHVDAHRTLIRRYPRWRLSVLLFTLVAVTVGAANAFWTSSGETAGSGATDTTLPLTLSTGTPSTELRPGGQADVAVTIANANAAPVHLVTLSLDLSQGTAGLSVDGAHSTCDTSTLTFANQTTGWTIPARSESGDGTLDIVLADSISMATTAADSC